MLVNPMNSTTPAGKFVFMFFSAALEVSEPLVGEACEASDEPDADEVIVADADADAEPEPAAVEEGATAESCMEDTGSPDVSQALLASSPATPTKQFPQSAI
ncbi:hypothetical protein ACEPAI_4455 [Sanghuangporus weigelae]